MMTGRPFFLSDAIVLVADTAIGLAPARPYDATMTLLDWTRPNPQMQDGAFGPETWPEESRTGPPGSSDGSRAGSTGQSSAHKSRRFSARSQAPSPPKLKPVRKVRAGSALCRTCTCRTIRSTASAYRCHRPPRAGASGRR